MNNVVDIQVTPEKIIIKIPRANIVEEIDNMAFFDSKSEKMIKKDMEQGIQVGQSIQFKDGKPFQLFFDAQFFKPEASALFLWTWLNSAINKVAGNIVFRVQAKLELHILFDNYERTAKEKQAEFEYLVFHYLWAKKIVINGKEKQPIAPASNLSWLLLLTLQFIFIVAFCILSALPMSAWVTFMSNANLSPILTVLLSFLSILILFVSIYFGYLISIVIWLLCLKPFVETDILLRTLKYQFNMPLVRKIDKPTRFFIRFILSESIS